MAIRIPSKNIYDKKNAKVRDNVIERIEVGAVDVVPDNKYETPVYNKDILFLENESKIESVESKAEIGLKSDEQGGEFPGTYYAVVMIDNKNTYLEGTIEIPKLKDNHYVNRVYYEQNGKNDIGVSIYSKKTTQSALVNYIIPSYDINNPQEPYFASKSYGSEILEETKTGLIDLPFVVEESYEGAYAKVGSLPNTTNLVLDYKEKENSYSIKYKILSIVEISYFKGKGYRSWLEEVIIPCSGEKVKYEATKIEFTIYGDTIGIDLQDKVVYIPDGDKTSKKVISFDGNELMQTTNHTAGNASDFISTQFALTKENYAKGKETCTILCSISDYYDYDTGELKISAKGTPLKMCFDEHDQVIPMVYGADGNDYPMSLNADGTPKVFAVLGTKIFYDGEVLQELYLQET